MTRLTKTCQQERTKLVSKNHLSVLRAAPGGLETKGKKAYQALALGLILIPRHKYYMISVKCKFLQNQKFYEIET